jgi:hypothetical protein
MPFVVFLNVWSTSLKFELKYADSAPMHIANERDNVKYSLTRCNLSR